MRSKWFGFPNPVNETSARLVAGFVVLEALFFLAKAALQGNLKLFSAVFQESPDRLAGSAPALRSRRVAEPGFPGFTGGAP